MCELLVSRSTCVLIAALMPAAAFAQSATYHLHREGSKTAGLFQLKSGGPDAGANTITLDLKNQPANEFLVKAFDTAAGTPGMGGVIPAGSDVTFRLWMRKTALAGVMFARAKLRLNSAAGPLLCDATAAAPLTTTVVAQALSCRTT